MSGIPQSITNQYLSPNITANSRTYNQQNLFNDSSSSLQTKFRQTGYIIGPPVAYTKQPVLPSNFKPFSPEKQSSTQYNNLPIVFRANQTISREINPSKNVIITNSLQYPSSNQGNISSHSIGYSQNDTVPRVTYQRCVLQCKNWQTKYNQLHLKYLNATTSSQNSSGLRQQNQRLKQRVRQLQAKQNGFYQYLQLQFNDLVNRYRDSTMKQCLLLMDRYRLQCKNIERQR